jgi:hypothetical protein
VVSRALTWRLDPYAVAQATYQTPNGQVGYYGSLCQAIIENSGRLDPSYGGVKYEHVGDWNKLRATAGPAVQDGDQSAGQRLSGPGMGAVGSARRGARHHSFAPS